MKKLSLLDELVFLLLARKVRAKHHFELRGVEEISKSKAASLISRALFIKKANYGKPLKKIIQYPAWQCPAFDITVVSCVLTPVFDFSHFRLQMKRTVIGCQLLLRCLKGKWGKLIRSKYFHLDQKWRTSTYLDMKGHNKKRWTDTSVSLNNWTTLCRF